MLMSCCCQVAKHQTVSARGVANINPHAHHTWHGNSCSHIFKWCVLATKKEKRTSTVKSEIVKGNVTFYVQVLCSLALWADGDRRCQPVWRIRLISGLSNFPSFYKSVYFQPSPTISHGPKGNVQKHNKCTGINVMVLKDMLSACELTKQCSLNNH